MATHFVKILSRLGWVSVPEPARPLFSGETDKKIVFWQTYFLSIRPSLWGETIRGSDNSLKRFQTLVGLELLANRPPAAHRPPATWTLWLPQRHCVFAA